MARADQGIK